MQPLIAWIGLPSTQPWCTHWLYSPGNICFYFSCFLFWRYLFWFSVVVFSLNWPLYFFWLLLTTSVLFCALCRAWLCCISYTICTPLMLFRIIKIMHWEASSFNLAFRLPTWNTEDGSSSNYITNFWIIFSKRSQLSRKGIIALQRKQMWSQKKVKTVFYSQVSTPAWVKEFKLYQISQFWGRVFLLQNLLQLHQLEF